MKRYALFALALLILLPGPAAATVTKPVPLKRVLGAVERPFATKTSSRGAIADFKAEFSQTSRIAALDRRQKGEGTVTVQLDRGRKEGRPLPRFRWRYERPNPQEIVCDGRTLWVYQPDNHQVIQSKIDLASRREANDPLLFLTELGHLSAVFTPSWAEPKQDEQGNFLLQLIPKHPSPLLQRLVIAVRKKALEHSAGGTPVFPIAATTVFDAEGNSTHIRFHHVRINLALPDAAFRFKVPKGVEVLHSMPKFNP